MQLISLPSSRKRPLFNFCLFLLYFWANYWESFWLVGRLWLDCFLISHSFPDPASHFCWSLNLCDSLGRKTAFWSEKEPQLLMRCFEDLFMMIKKLKHFDILAFQKARAESASSNCPKFRLELTHSMGNEPFLTLISWLFSSEFWIILVAADLFYLCIAQFCYLQANKKWKQSKVRRISRKDHLQFCSSSL